jgi:hypothetical protein
MKSVMKHSFSTTPTISAPRSKFDRSFAHKTTFDGGWLVPFYWDEVLPGDTFNVSATIFARMSTPSFPVMDNMFLDTQYFFVPYRQIWDNWRKFCGEQANPADSIDYTIPVLQTTSTTASKGDPDLAVSIDRHSALLNYLGIPHGISPNDVEISELPFRAYNHIFNEWYRDQNLIDSLEVATGDASTTTPSTKFRLKRRGKRHDYFTSALPWPQKGGVGVSLPLGTKAYVGHDQVGSAQDIGIQDFTRLPTNTVHYKLSNNAGDTFVETSNTAIAQSVSLYADLTNATAATINDLREAFQIQKLLERDARAGTRYAEIVKNHFGVDFIDVTYRPEYLGGGSQSVNINPVAQTDTNVGDLAAFGTSSGTSGFTKSFVEHGIVMGLLSVRADITYQQGLNRLFSHSTRYDKYWPSLAHLGEQAILNKEIYCQGTTADDDVFGYQERYAEYRYKPSMITGLFQSDVTASLDAWHLSQDFASLPTLGQTFIEDNPPIDRVIAVPTEPHFIMDSYIKQICARPMPLFGVPGMIDHF